MPFQGFRRYAYTQISILQNAPQAPGVYGISNAQQWLLVGSSDDVQGALLEHVRQAGSAVWRQQPTGFTYESWGVDHCAERQRQLIAELRPRCNRE